MDFTLAKLSTANKNDWFVYYRVLNPRTGKRVLFKERQGLNRIKNLRERKHEFNLLATAINQKLKDGWTPFEGPKEIEENKNKENFYWWFQNRLNYSTSIHGFYNTRKLQSVFNKLKEYSPELKVKQLTYSFLKKYEVYLKEQKRNSANTIADNMMRISIIMREIENDGYIQRKENPFHIIKFNTERTVKERLNEQQIIQLIKIKLEGQTDLARDMYLFSFYCAGIRFGDLARLKHSMCKNARLQYEMHKTKNKKKERNVLLLDQAKKIIKKYSKNKPYIFPLNINWNNEEQSINSENTRLNKYLKKACKKADIPQLTFHTSRNTFADIAVKRNTGTRQLKELFGHSKESTTEIYMSDFYQEETDDALKNIFK